MPGFVPLRVSLQRPPDAALRDALRLLGMVHELHKVGYQRLRIRPGMAPNGLHWRCTLLPAALDGAADGKAALAGLGLSPDQLPPAWSSGQGRAYFGWADCGGDDSRRLADRFLDRFEAMARVCAGLDFAYAGWFSLVLGKAENGTFPVFHADYEILLRDEDVPPPPPEAA